MRRLVIAGDSDTALERASRAAAAAGPELIAELDPRTTGDVLGAVARADPEMVAYASSRPGPLGLDATAMQLAFGASCRTLLLTAEGAWPPARIVFPLTTSDVRTGQFVHAWDHVRSLFPGDTSGWTLELVHVGRDADEWDQARELLAAQIGVVAPPGCVTAGGCLRFGAPVGRRTVQLLASAQWDLAVLVRPAAVSRFHSAGEASDWLRLPGGCRMPLLVLPAARSPGPPDPAGAGWRRWLAPLPAA